MTQLLAHLVGDYVLQNHAMANRKTSSWPWALLHAALYGLPFLLLTTDWRALAIIVGTHAVIDRYRLARYWVEFWGVGVPDGRVARWVMDMRGYMLISTRSSPEATPHYRWLRRGGAPEYLPATQDAPRFLSVWLLILVDNTMHLCINYAALATFSG